MKRIFLTFIMCSFSAIAYAEVPVNTQTIFQPEATRPLYNIEKNYYTNSAINRLIEPPKQEEEEVQQESPLPEKKKGLFEGFTVEW